MIYSQRLMCKQWVGEVRYNGRAWWVMTTGESKYLLFVCVQGFQRGVPGSGWAVGDPFPIAKKDLKRGVVSVSTGRCLWREEPLTVDEAMASYTPVQKAEVLAYIVYCPDKSKIGADVLELGQRIAKEMQTGMAEAAACRTAFCHGCGTPLGGCTCEAVHSAL